MGTDGESEQTPPPAGPTANGPPAAYAPNQTSGGDPLASPEVRAAMQQAWVDSRPHDPDNRHEEGGYIVRNPDGTFGVVRWPRGGGSSITPPTRAPDGSYGGLPVDGEFHTHPNPDIDEAGRTWQESPSPGDLVGVRAENYPGDSYVIGHNNVYRVTPAGIDFRIGGRDATLR